MSDHPLLSWLFLACLKTYRHPWLADEIPRIMFDDERLRYRRNVVAKA